MAKCNGSRQYWERHRRIMKKLSPYTVVRFQSCNKYGKYQTMQKNKPSAPLKTDCKKEEIGGEYYLAHVK